MIKILAAPAKAGGRAYVRVVSAAVGGAAGVLTKVLGAQFLKDLQTFVAALETVFGSFRERADHTYRMLQQPGTAFVVVATPEPDALREASYFVERLAEDRMPLAGLVLNRVQTDRTEGLSGERAAAAAASLEDTEEHQLVASMLRVHVARMARRDREQALAARFVSAHPKVQVVQVPALAEDVHDLDGLRDVGALLAASADK